MHQTSIAVVIPTRNRGESVAATVHSLLADRGTGFEVIVVDQSDDDVTQRAISSLQAPNLRYVRMSTRGSAAARNVGIGHARSDLVAMTDDDCEVRPGWTDGLVEEFSRHDRIGLVFGNVIAVDHDRTAGFIPACVRGEASLARGVSEMHMVEGMGACMGVRRSAWAQLGGFDETLGSGAVLRSAAEGDFTLRALRAGYFVYQSPRWSVLHHGFRPWEEAGGLVRQYWYGAGAMYAKPVKSGDSRVWPLFARLARRWAFGRSPVAASLGDRPYRWVRLAAFLRGFAAGLMTPIDRSSGHYLRPRRWAHVPELPAAMSGAATAGRPVSRRTRRRQDAGRSPSHGYRSSARRVPLDRQELSARVDSGLAFLRSEQRPSGEFPTFKALAGALGPESPFDSTPFATTYVLHCLSFVERPGVAAMVARGLDFLESEMEPHGVWRYWTSSHPKHGFIPPDLDDTCCASAVLRRFGRTAPDNRELILANRNRDGLFYTWLVPRPARTRSRAYWTVTLHQSPPLHRQLNFWRLTEARPRDVDCVVNANVLHDLGDTAAAQSVVDFLGRELSTGRTNCCDKWHLNACAFYYAVSRAYASGVTRLEPLRAPLAAQAARALGEPARLAPAEVALAACALLNLREREPCLDDAARCLAETQRENGAWPAYALYYGGPKRTYGWGSDALTTGLCVEAIARFVAEPAVEPEWIEQVAVR